MKKTPYSVNQARSIHKPTIGIIIVHYGQTKNTLDCLESLQKITPGKYMFHVFLVDNDLVHRFSPKKIPAHLPTTYIVSPTNGGFAAGINIGMKKALEKNFTYLFFLNNDASVRPDIFEKMLFHFFQDERLGLLSPLLVYDDNPEKIWCTSGKINETFLFTTYPYMNKKLSEIRLPKLVYSDFGGAALLVKSEVCKTIGFLDEKYFLFGEDIEWCLRAKKAGFTLAYITEPLVAHKVSAGSGKKGTNILIPLGAYLYARNFFYLLADHPVWFNLFFAMVGQLCIRAPFYMMFRMQGLSSRKAYLRGVKEGLFYLFFGRIIPVMYDRF